MIFDFEVGDSSGIDGPESAKLVATVCDDSGTVDNLATACVLEIGSLIYVDSEYE